MLHGVIDSTDVFSGLTANDTIVLEKELGLGRRMGRYGVHNFNSTAVGVWGIALVRDCGSLSGREYGFLHQSSCW